MAAETFWCGCPMYVCLCNAMTERQVKGALEAGCRTVASVYRHATCRPQCGRCIPEIRQMLTEIREPMACAVAAE